MGLRTPEDRYDEFHPMPGAIVHYWPRDQAEGGEPLAAIVVNTGRGYGGPHLMILSAAADGYRFESAVPYGAEFGPAEAGSWTWPGGHPMDGEQRPAPKDATVKLPIEWATERGYVIADPDGWRGDAGRPFGDPVDRDEFGRRSGRCTLAPLSSESGWILFEGELERSGLDPEKVASLREVARRYRP